MFNSCYRRWCKWCKYDYSCSCWSWN